MPKIDAGRAVGVAEKLLALVPGGFKTSEGLGLSGVTAYALNWLREHPDLDPKLVVGALVGLALAWVGYAWLRTKHKADKLLLSPESDAPPSAPVEG